MRGSDKRHGVKVSAAVYARMARRFVERWAVPAATRGEAGARRAVVFVATDDPKLLADFTQRMAGSGARIVWTRAARSTKSFQCHAAAAAALSRRLPTWCKGGDTDGDSAPEAARGGRGRAVVERAGGRALGEQVLLDALLLSSCSMLLYAASSVPQFSIFWSLRLHHAAIDAEWYAKSEREVERFEWALEHSSLHVVIAEAPASHAGAGLAVALVRLGHRACVVQLPSSGCASPSPAVCSGAADGAANATGASVDARHRATGRSLLLLLGVGAAADMAGCVRQAVTGALVASGEASASRPPLLSEEHTLLLWPDVPERRLKRAAIAYGAHTVVATRAAACARLALRSVADRRLHCYWAPPAAELPYAPPTPSDERNAAQNTAVVRVATFTDSDGDATNASVVRRAVQQAGGELTVVEPNSADPAHAGASPPAVTPPLLWVLPHSRLIGPRAEITRLLRVAGERPVS
eukprot:2387848-Prymnesium_polylepis.1